MNAYLEEVNRIIDHYYRYVPEFGTSEYHEFIAKTRGEIGREFYKGEFQVFSANVNALAYTDFINVFLSPKVFTKEFYNGMLNANFSEKELTPLATTVINGFLIHEMGHLRYTSIDIFCDSFFDDVIWRVKKEFPTFEKTKQVLDTFKLIRNLIEDLYIDSILFKHDNGIFLKAAYYFLFTKEDAEKRWEFFQNSPSIMSALNVIIIANKAFFDVQNEEWYLHFKEINDLFEKSITDDPTLRDSAKITAEIFIKLLEMFGQDEEEEDENFGNSPFSDTQCDTKIDTDMFGEGEKQDSIDDRALEKVKNELNEIFNEEYKKEHLEAADLDAKLIAERVDEIEIEFNDFTAVKRSNITINKDFLNLGKILRNMREERLHKDLVTYNKGSRIKGSSLYRIATDSKIMTSNNMMFEDDGKPEVVFLLDISGSTHGSFVNEYGQKETLLNAIINASGGAFKSLLEARIPCAIYAHTTNSRKSAIFPVASYNMPLLDKDRTQTTHNWRERLQHLHSLHHSMNADGTAINFCSDRFTKKDCTKILIVLSDGRPTLSPRNFARTDYGIDDNSAYAKTMVNRARENGVEVISFSLTNEVVRNNDKIYGKEFNVRAFGNINRKMQEVIRMIGGG